MFGMFVLVALAIVIVGGLATVMWDRKGRTGKHSAGEEGGADGKVLQLFERARGRPAARQGRASRMDAFGGGQGGNFSAP